MIKLIIDSSNNSIISTDGETEAFHFFGRTPIEDFVTGLTKTLLRNGAESVEQPDGTIVTELLVEETPAIEETPAE